MGERAELEEIRMRLWGHFTAVNKISKVNMTFDQFWYEFLTRQFLSNHPAETVYEEVCSDLTKRVRLHG